MKNKNNYLDKRRDFTATPEGTADYPKKPAHMKVEQDNNKRK